MRQDWNLEFRLLESALQVRDYVRSLAEGEIATSITEIQGFRTNIQKMVDKVENLYHPISHSLSRLVRWVLRLRS